MEARSSVAPLGRASLAGVFAGRLPHVVAGVVVATVAAGAIARAGGDRLGAPLAPFFATWQPQAVLLAVPVALLLAAAVAVAPRLRDRPSPLTFTVLAFGLGLVLRLALAAARSGPERWYAVFGSDPEADHEYLPALPALGVGLHAFLDRFAEVAPSLPTHASGHPPGLLVTMDLLGVRSARGLSALTVGSGALCVPLTYALGRSLLSERGARTAALLFAFAPSALLYGTTSTDALYATLGLATAAALVARRRIVCALGPPALALASFFSPALLGAGAWSVVVLAASGRRRRALGVAGAVAITVAAFYALLHAATGFDPFGTLRALHAAYSIGIASARPYAFWLFGSPAAFLVAMGVPLAWLALRALALREPAALGLAAVVVAAAALGFTKAETERIWLFLVPFACIAAARALAPRRLRLVLGVLAAQALAVELLLFTVW